MKLKYVDKIHAYWLDGRRCKGVSTAAKIPDDTYSLDQWRKRQVALGLAKSPHLVAAVAAHHDDTDKLNELAEQAMQAAGSDVAATKGTAVHRIVERHIKGEEQMLTPEAEDIIVSYEAAMKAAGLVPIPSMVEQVVVFPEEKVCGRFDNVSMRMSDGELVVCDVKTGESAIRYPHGTVTQLAMYANAPLHARVPIGANFETTKFEEAGQLLNKEEGYVISITDMGTAIYVVNLKLGWQAVEKIIFPTIRWRAIPNEQLIKRV